MAVVTSALQLRLIDRVSGPMRGLTGLFGRFRREAAGLNMAGGALGGLGMRVLALGGAYIGVDQGIRRTVGAARTQQAALTEIGIKAELTGTQLSDLQRRMADLAPTVNQGTDELLAGIDAMVTLGLDADRAAAAIPAIGKAATATMSQIDDLAAASVAAMQNMGVGPGEIATMLDAMAEAGNQGAFEVRDMAKAFPALTASAKSLGIQGVKGVTDMAAALQIARRGAGDASTAANNMANFLQKLMSPQVIKNFKKFGIDATKELKKAHEKGISPIEHFIGLVDKATKGGRADLLGQLFGDKQVLEFVRPMLADFKDYIRIRGDAERASGTVADAYARRMEDAEQKIKALRIAVGNLGTAVGSELLGPIGAGAQHLADLLNSLDERATVFDKIKAGVDGLLAGLGGKSPDLRGQLKAIEGFIFGVKDAGAAADELGRTFNRFQEIGKSLREGSIFSPSTIVSITLGGLALRGLGGALGKLPFGGPLKLALLATGVSALAASGEEMSAVDWAALGIALTAFAGGLKKLWPFVGLLTLASTIQKFGPDIASRGRKPKPGEPATWLGIDPTETREERLERLNEERTRSLGGPAQRGRDSGDVDRERGLDSFLDGPPRPSSGVSIREMPPIRGMVTTQPSGVQRVEVTNPVRPNVNINVNMHNNFAGGADEGAVRRMGEQLGGVIKSDVEGDFGFSDGGL